MSAVDDVDEFIASIPDDDTYDHVQLEWPDLLDWTVFDLVLSHVRRSGPVSRYFRRRSDVAAAEGQARATPPLAPQRHWLSQRTQEKLAFSVGVLGLWMLAWLLGRWPSLVPRCYALAAVALVSVRFALYRTAGWHYFLADLCYYANLLLLLWLFVMPHSRALYIGVFALVHGPVCWAIVAWRNSMVFHSLDKVTSLFIHVMPAITLYALRWLQPSAITGMVDNNHISGDVMDITHGANVLAAAGDMTFVESLVYGLSLYAVWQTLYFVGIMLLKRHKIAAGTRVTSYSWLLDPRKNEHRQNLMYRLCTVPGWGRGPYQLGLFVFWQFLYALLTVLPTSLMHRYWQLHLLFLTVVGCVSVWNGASFYCEVFRFNHHRVDGAASTAAAKES